MAKAAGKPQVLQYFSPAPRERSLFGEHFVHWAITFSVILVVFGFVLVIGAWMTVRM